MEFTVPGYRVEELLGAGSQAEVWSARSVETGEPVALKRIALPSGEDPGRLADRLALARGEAALLAALEHPSLIRLHRYVQTPTAAVLVMELAEGGSLAQLLRRRERLTPAEVAAALSPVAAALAFAHDEGVLHGDISAGNILFTSAGRAKLSDLGVARMAFGDRGHDPALGTPAYLDPVVAAGAVAGPSSDVFSLAAVALHCLTGAGPWQADGTPDVAMLLARATTGVIDRLDDRLAGCPPPMAAVLRRALDAEPYRRGSAAEFALDLGASVPPGSVVLAAGRIPPRVGRHSVDRHAPAVTDAVPVDLTQVARSQVRPEASAPRPAGRRGWWGRWVGRVRSEDHGLRGDRSQRQRRERRARHGRRLVPTALVAVTMLAVAAAVQGPVWLGRVDGSRQARTTRPAPATVRTPHPTATAGSTGPAAPDASQSPVDVVAALRRLADRRAAAFAANRPDLLAGVYESPVLLAEDAALLGARIPAGCGLSGMQTSYTGVTVTRSTGRRIELRVTANQPPATLMCQGTVRGRTAPAAPARLVVTLLRVGTDFRIAAQQASP